MPRGSSHLVYIPSSNFLILRSIAFFENPPVFMLFRIWILIRAIWMSFSSSSSRSSSSDSLPESVSAALPALDLWPEWSLSARKALNALRESPAEWGQSRTACPSPQRKQPLS